MDNTKKGREKHADKCKCDTENGEEIFLECKPSFFFQSEHGQVLCNTAWTPRIEVQLVLKPVFFLLHFLFASSPSGVHIFSRWEIVSLNIKCMFSLRSLSSLDRVLAGVGVASHGGPGFPRIRIGETADCILRRTV